MSDTLVLYRCRTPTNVLCPCGTVARRLHKMELDYRTQRVPYRRKGRPEIEELTGQDRVPVIVDGDEVIHDSKRILQYLEWRHGGEQAEKDEKPKKPERRQDKKGSRRRRRRRSRQA